MKTKADFFSSELLIALFRVKLLRAFPLWSVDTPKSPGDSSPYIRI